MKNFFKKLFKKKDYRNELEEEMLGKGRCPDCKSKEFWEGPRGGMAMNITCAKCGSRFNIVPGLFCQRI